MSKWTQKAKPVAAATKQATKQQIRNPYAALAAGLNAVQATAGGAYPDYFSAADDGKHIGRIDSIKLKPDVTHCFTEVTVLESPVIAEGDKRTYGISLTTPAGKADFKRYLNILAGFLLGEERDVNAEISPEDIEELCGPESPFVGMVCAWTTKTRPQEKNPAKDFTKVFVDPLGWDGEDEDEQPAAATVNIARPAGYPKTLPWPPVNQPADDDIPF